MPSAKKVEVGRVLEVEPKSKQSSRPTAQEKKEKDTALVASTGKLKMTAPMMKLFEDGQTSTLFHLGGLAVVGGLCYLSELIPADWLVERSCDFVFDDYAAPICDEAFDCATAAVIVFSGICLLISASRLITIHNTIIISQTTAKRFTLGVILLGFAGGRGTEVRKDVLRARGTGQGGEQTRLDYLFEQIVAHGVYVAGMLAFRLIDVKL
ncbi:hypothetical protein TI39_contig4326g00003 [Zymoseptoria brevis]|uniref:Uncharacterized protein n=1 Tax=Zymoseptoria brevis TaxID=1047168 RepID=A0A0F4G8N2_9PEZI|nr:hypothetical protein TI39_contig4326g00003 [Zymoseptoria brevis]